MVKETLHAAEQRMKKSVEVIQSELASVRTGKATTALLDGIKWSLTDNSFRSSKSVM